MTYDAAGGDITAMEDESGARLRSHVTWGAADLVLGVIAAAILVFVVSIAIVLPVAAKYGDDTPQAYFASAVAALVWDAGFVLTALYFARKHGGGLPDLGLRPAWFAARGMFSAIVRAAPIPKLPAAIIAGYVLTYASVIVYGVIVDVTGATFLEPSEQLPEGLFDSSVVVAMTGVAIVVGAPIAEEVIFRGFLFGGLRRYLPILPAMLVSGFVFSLAHFNVGLVIPFTIVGAILAYIYERSGTLYANIGVHFLFNLTSYSFIVLFPELR